MRELGALLCTATVSLLGNPGHQLQDVPLVAIREVAGLAGKSSFRGNLWEWRYRPSLDLSPWIDRPTTTTSLDRLDTECGEPLRELGFTKSDGDADWGRPRRRGRPWRPVWTGYTPEQRRLIRNRNKPAAVSDKELV